MDDRTVNRLIHAIPSEDLHEICRELGLRTVGGKEELYRRAIRHLQSDDGARRSVRGGGSIALKELMRHLGMATPSIRPTAPLGEPGLMCVCSGSGQGSQHIQCTRCYCYQHKACVGRAALTSPYQCPLCHMRQLDPFETILDVILPPTLCQTFGGGIAQKQFPYSMNQHVKLLEPGRRRMVQVRCVRLDNEGYTQNWPKECSILVNGRAVYQVRPPSKDNPRKRRDSPLNITNLSPATNNQAMVLKQKEDDAYAFAIFIVEQSNLETVFNRFLYENVLSPEAGRSFIVSQTSDVNPESSRQSLKCPLTRYLPDNPARGWLCRHVQCFDLFPYMVMQIEAKANRWKCPICGAMVAHVYVDNYIKSIVNWAREIPGCSLVEFQANGLYRLVTEDQGMDSSDEDDLPIKRSASPASDDCIIKQPKLESGTLAWKDFFQGLSQAALHCSLVYQYALQRRPYGSTPSQAKTVIKTVLRQTDGVLYTEPILVD